MIHVEKNQEIPENPKLRVASESGDYDDEALIEFYSTDKNSSIVQGSLQAQYIKYGGLVYKFNDPKDLGEAILEIDPNSTHSAASYVRMSKELLEKMNRKTLGPDSIDQMLADENIKTEDEIIKNQTPTINPNPTSITPTTPTSNSTTTPVANTSSTTPIKIENIETDPITLEVSPEELTPSFKVESVVKDVAPVVTESEN